MNSVTKVYTIKSNAQAVFRALTDPIEMEHWSGSQAVMDTCQGGVFSMWGSSIHGINTLISTKRIEQDWKEESWEEYSKVVFIINEIEDGVELKLMHTQIPSDSVEDIDQGWDEYYLSPLKVYLEQ